MPLDSYPLRLSRPAIHGDDDDDAPNEVFLFVAALTKDASVVDDVPQQRTKHIYFGEMGPLYRQVPGHTQAILSGLNPSGASSWVLTQTHA